MPELSCPAEAGQYRTDQAGDRVHQEDVPATGEYGNESQGN